MTGAATWRRIPGWEDYEASDAGQIRSWKSGQPRLLSPVFSQGYPVVNLRAGGRAKVHRLHVLVMAAHVGPRPTPETHVRHLDGNPLNNALSNLRYGTPHENSVDRVRHGRHPNVQKTHCPAGHPYDEDNTYVLPSRPTARYCRSCRAERHRRVAAARRQAVAA